MSAEKISPVIALLGQPNSGKSTLFNGLTGLRQHVGNWPGKTVDQKEGHFKRNNTRYKVVDLPGTYSLSANSEEEVITRDYIAGGNADVVCILTDASQLERSMFMLADFVGIHVPVILVLNMMDVAKEQGKTIKTDLLQERLGVPVLPFSATDSKNYGDFFKVLDSVLENKKILKAESLKEKYRKIPSFNEMEQMISKGKFVDYSSEWLASKLVEKDAVVIERVKRELNKEERNRLDYLLSSIQNGALITGEKKFEWVDELLEAAVVSKKETVTLGKFDRLATSKRWGKIVAVGIILIGLVLSFIPATPVMMLGFLFQRILYPLVNEGLTALGAPDFIIGLISQGIINAVALAITMVGFVFGITLVFGFLEEIGYMARISYVFDNSMSKLGLQGKSMMPFLVCLGCTIGGATGSRTIDNWGQRILTIALAWAVPCAATWGIVPMMSTVFFGAAAPLVIVIIFLVTILHMWITAKIFGRRLIKEKDRTGLIMELPPYHKPKWKSLFRYVFGRSRDILWRAVKVIVTVSVIFWILSYSANSEVNHSIIYKIGTAIEPVTSLFGFRWQTFIAFLSSAVSKESALGVLNSLYTGTGNIFMTIQGGELSENLGTILVNQIAPAEALAFIFAVTFNIPCVAAVAATYQETHSMKWTLRIAGYYILMAFVLAFLAYRIGLLIF